jgi:hypothetical protein
MATEPPDPPQGPPGRPPAPEAPQPAQVFRAPGEEIQPPPPAGPRFSEYRRGQRFPLRQMDIGELLDAAINLYRVHWKTFMGIAAVILVPVQFAQSFVVRQVLGASLTAFTSPPRITQTPDPFTTTPAEPLVPSTETLLNFVLVTFITAAVGFVATGLVSAAVARAGAETYQGRDPAVGATLGFALRRLHSILWVLLLVGLATAGGLFLCIIPGIIFYVRFVLSAPTFIIEGTKGTDALRRSWRLSKNHSWKIFGMLVLSAIISAAVSFVFSIPFTFIGAGMETWGWAVQATGTSIAQILVAPFATIVQVLLYFDMRIRKEGFDLSVMAAALEQRG